MILATTTLKAQGGFNVVADKCTFKCKKAPTWIRAQVLHITFLKICFVSPVYVKCYLVVSQTLSAVLGTHYSL